MKSRKKLKLTTVAEHRDSDTEDDNEGTNDDSEMDFNLDDFKDCNPQQMGANMLKIVKGFKKYEKEKMEEKKKIKSQGGRPKGVQKKIQIQEQLAKMKKSRVRMNVAGVESAMHAKLCNRKKFISSPVVAEVDAFLKLVRT
jgi:hypothetical protein